MRLIGFPLTGALLLSASLAAAGTQVKGSIVPNDPTGNPQLSSRSGFSMKGSGAYSVKLKGMTDATGAPVPVTTVTTPDAQYWVTVRGEAVGFFWEYNIPISVVEPGQARLKGTVALISAVPAGNAIGVHGVEVHAPTPDPGSTADCQTLMTDPGLPGVFVSGVSAFPTNPCASGARMGLTGIMTGR